MDSPSERPPPPPSLPVPSTFATTLDSAPAPPSPALPPTLPAQLTPPPQPERSQHDFQDGHTLASKAARSASQWNSLLLYARKGRGAQWDYGTSMYHVDRGSEAYYAGVVRAAEDPLESSRIQPGMVSVAVESGRPRRTRAAPSAL